MFFSVQDPNQGQSLSGLVAPENSLFCCNRVPFPRKTLVLLQQGAIFLENQWFCCNRVPFSLKTMVLLQQGTTFFEKQWFCCNRVQFSSKNHGFVATRCNFPPKTMDFSLKTIYLVKTGSRGFWSSMLPDWWRKIMKKCAKMRAPPPKKQKKPKTMKTVWSSARDLFFVMD